MIPPLLRVDSAETVPLVSRCADFVFLTRSRRVSWWCLGLLACLVVGGIAENWACGADAGSVTFERDVMATLSKGGCNAGTCHGNVNGKGGFFLSLRGQDPEFDYVQLVQADFGRRVNRLEPEQSLLLRKATGSIPHEGGKRFSSDSPEFEILRSWITGGLVRHNAQAPVVTHLRVEPADSVLWHPKRELSLAVTAHFSDGTHRDVTRLAVFEPSDPRVHVTAEGTVRFSEPGVVTVLVRYLAGQFPVRVAYRPAHPEFVWQSPPENNFIDEIVFARLRQLRINPAPPAEEHVFLRRVYLDLLGVLPTAEEARAYVADTSPEKQASLVDRLLERPEFSARWAQKWSDLIRNEEKTLDAKGVELLHAWLKESFATDRPLNQFVQQLIASRGSTYANPPANFWRAHREPFVRSETIAQVFLGVRLQCAKCHNHPFDRWSQDEYYNWTALFTDLDYEIVKNERKDKLDSHEFVGEQIVLVKEGKPIKNPRTGQPATPRFLGDSRAVDGDRLEQLADWLASSENRLFATAQTNRIWYHVMGRGLVEPIDDLRDTNPASHPELLKRLTEELIQHNFSTKHLVRTIVLSRTYQLSSVLPSADIDETSYDEHLYARAVVRRLTAEQILDAQSQTLGIPAKFEGYPAGTTAGEVAGVERVRRTLAEGDAFLRLFGKPERLLSCECERSDEATLGQALSLVGGASLHERLKHPQNRLGALLSSNRTHPEIIDELFWTVLSRPATPRERQILLEQMERSENPRLVLEDLTWAILNAKELLFRN